MGPRRLRPSLPWSAFADFCFPPEVIVLSVRWYMRFALSYRDVEELLAERGIEVDHITVYRWAQHSMICCPRHGIGPTSTSTTASNAPTAG